MTRKNAELSPKQEAVLRLARSVEAWDVGSGLDALDAPMRRCEAVIHELSHAVVFGLELALDVSGTVSEIFSMVYRHKPRVSDLSECEGLAVEKRALQRLGWAGLFPWACVVESARRDMRTMVRFATVSKHVNRFAARRVADQRATKVLDWLGQIQEEKT